jgi:adenylate cyclase
VITRWSYLLTIAVPIFAVVLMAVAKPPFLPDLSRLIFDWYQRLDPRVWDPASPVRIVDIDDESLARIGQWPWPRSTVAEIVTRLGELGAAVVTVDLVFAEPDASSPEQVLRLLPSTPGRALLEQEIQVEKSNDAALASALAVTPGVLGTILTTGAAAADYPTKFGIVAVGDDPHQFLPRFSSAVVPLRILSDAAAGLGALNWLPDSDQIVRRVPLVARLGDRIVPSLALDALRVAQGASTIIVRSSNASGQSAFGAHTGVNAIKVGDLEIPCDAEAELRVRYSHSERGRFVPAWKILAGTAERGDIEGRIIVLGTSAVGLRDQRGTPIDASVSGVEIHAQVIEQALAGAWLVRPDWSPGAELFVAVFLALAIGLMLPLSAPVSSAVWAAGLVAALAWASWHQFAVDGILLDPTLPGSSILLTYGAGVVWLYRDEQLRRRHIREAFGRYVSPAIVARLADDPKRLVLGGEIRTLTIMFCDVRGFTTIAERLDAQGLTQFMNEYLTSMSDAVLDSGGTIDKYIGDAIMAFWNAPLDERDHARRAARAALAMVSALGALNDRWRAAAAARGEPHQDVKFGIGLATGECCVGNFGSVHRFDYSAMGDQVNLASRLEGATKFYQTDILASQATRDSSPDLAWLDVDAVRVKGKSNVARVYTLAGDEATRQSPAFAELADIHERIMASYRSGDFARAAVLAIQARTIATTRLRDLYGALERRCRALEQCPPDNWVAITEFAEK